MLLIPLDTINLKSGVSFKLLGLPKIDSLGLSSSSPPKNSPWDTFGLPSSPRKIDITLRLAISSLVTL